MLGALFGYLIGFYGGRPLLNKLFKSDKVKTFEKIMLKYGSLAILIAGFSLIPYKFMTITSGVLRFPIKHLIIYSVISRGLRFFLEGIMILYVGQAAIEFITGPKFLFLTLGIALIGVIIYGLFLLNKKT
ncbi:MAG: hypothetical protein PWP31_1853 [Clostridia bacterium]|nr:hypothetical protein [Clostridia bacterium]